MGAQGFHHARFYLEDIDYIFFQHCAVLINFYIISPKNKGDAIYGTLRLL
jgi:hypothetical protein